MMMNSTRDESMYFSVTEAPEVSSNPQNYSEEAETLRHINEDIGATSQYHSGDDPIRCCPDPHKRSCDTQTSAVAANSLPPAVETSAVTESGVSREQQLVDQEVPSTVEAGGDLPPHSSEEKTTGCSLTTIGNAPALASDRDSGSSGSDDIGAPILTAEISTDQDAILANAVLSETLAFELHERSNPVDNHVAAVENLPERAGREFGDTGEAPWRQFGRSHVDDADDVEDWSMLAQAGSDIDDDENAAECTAARGDGVTSEDSTRADSRVAEKNAGATVRGVRSTLAEIIEDDSGHSSPEENDVRDFEDMRMADHEAPLQGDDGPNLSNQGARSAISTDASVLNESSTAVSSHTANTARAEKGAETNEDLYGPRVWEVHAAFLMAVLAIIWIAVNELVSRFTAWMQYPEL